MIHFNTAYNGFIKKLVYKKLMYIIFFNTAKKLEKNRWLVFTILYDLHYDFTIFTIFFAFLGFLFYKINAIFFKAKSKSMQFFSMQNQNQCNFFQCKIKINANGFQCKFLTKELKYKEKKINEINLIKKLFNKRLFLQRN